MIRKAILCLLASSILLVGDASCADEENVPHFGDKPAEQPTEGGDGAGEGTSNEEGKEETGSGKEDEEQFWSPWVK